jgi:alginate O-acetyltransferase complex protein AlgF
VAFVRVVNATAGKTPIQVDLGATRYDKLGFAEVSPYRPIVPDIYQIRAADHEEEIIPKIGLYYTVVCAPKGIYITEDLPHTDPARAQLFLYNFSSFPRVDLKTADGKTSVISAVAPHQYEQVVVNAISVSFAVFSGGTRLGEVGDLDLERGSSFSVFVLDGEAFAIVFAVKAQVLGK